MAAARPARGGAGPGLGARGAEKRAGLGDEFLDSVAAALRELEHNPELSRLYYRNFRRVLLRRFPYKFFYQVIAQRVVIFRVLHARQDHPRGVM